MPRSKSPVTVRPFPLMCETDPKSILLWKNQSYESPNAIEYLLLMNLTRIVYIKHKSLTGTQGCFELVGTLDFVEKMRAIVAINTGFSPAPFHSFLPEYDLRFLREYRYSYTAECRYGNRKCVRPSHFVLLRCEGFNTRYPLVQAGRVILPEERS